MAGVVGRGEYLNEVPSRRSNVGIDVDGRASRAWKEAAQWHVKM